MTDPGDNSSADEKQQDSDKTVGVVGQVSAKTIVIPNKRGLHARAAAKFASVAEQYQAQIEVSRDGQVVSARSIMGLMMLGAGQGTEISIHGEGLDAADGVEKLSALVSSGFGEAE